MTINETVDLLSLVLLAGLFFFIWFGWQRIRAANKLRFFMLRRRLSIQGWRIILLGLSLGVCSLILRMYGRQAAYILVPPTASTTPTSTASATPSQTPTPTITPTPLPTLIPSLTPTPSTTPTPQIPEAITVLFRETVTPRPEAIFSAIEVARRLDALNRPLQPSQEFENPIESLFGAFSYDFLDDGARWTALWYRGEEIVCSETKPWDGGTGGYGFTDCTPADGWQPGEYEIRMFLGENWKISTRFRVQGQAPTATPTSTATVTETATP